MNIKLFTRDYLDKVEKEVDILIFDYPALPCLKILRHRSPHPAQSALMMMAVIKSVSSSPTPDPLLFLAKYLAVVLIPQSRFWIPPWKACLRAISDHPDLSPTPQDIIIHLALDEDGSSLVLPYLHRLLQPKLRRSHRKALRLIFHSTTDYSIVTTLFRVLEIREPKPVGTTWMRGFGRFWIMARGRLLHYDVENNALLGSIIHSTSIQSWEQVGDDIELTMGNGKQVLRLQDPTEFEEVMRGVFPTPRTTLSTPHGTPKHAPFSPISLVLLQHPSIPVLIQQMAVGCTTLEEWKRKVERGIRRKFPEQYEEFWRQLRVTEEGEEYRYLMRVRGVMGGV